MRFAAIKKPSPYVRGLGHILPENGPVNPVAAEDKNSHRLHLFLGERILKCS